MAEARRKTKYPGVYEIVSTVRTHQGKPDRVFYVSYKADGKKVWEKAGWSSEGYSAKVAADLRAERVRSVRHGDEIPRKKKFPLFGDVATKYLEWARANKTRTGDDDRGWYEKHLKERFAEKRLNEITPFDLERVKADLLKAEYAPATVRHVLATVRQIYNKAKAWKLYAGPNPVAGVKLPVAKNARERFLSFTEADLLLAELKKRKRASPDLHDLALLSLHTGARFGELVALRARDVNIETRMITFLDTKNRRPHHVYLTDQALAVLAARLPSDASEYVFKSRGGKKIKQVTRTFRRLADKLFNKGVTDRRQRVTFHSLRHTHASWLALEGETVQTIAELLGHRTLEMAKRYSHLTPDHKKRAVLNLERAFAEGKKNTKKVEANHEA